MIGPMSSTAPTSAMPRANRHRADEEDGLSSPPVEPPTDERARDEAGDGGAAHGESDLGARGADVLQIEGQQKHRRVAERLKKMRDDNEDEVARDQRFLPHGLSATCHAVGRLRCRPCPSHSNRPPARSTAQPISVPSPRP